VPYSDDAINWYESRAETLARQYEALAAENLLTWLVDLLPVAPALVIDVGAGTGRDAALFAARGHQVVAIEPSSAMRQEGQRLHPGDQITWLDDRLPGMATTLRLGLAADVILVSAVWQHVAPADRPRAFRKLASLLKPGGLLALSLRHGPADPERHMHPVSQEEIERLAREQGLVVTHAANSADTPGGDLDSCSVAPA
jgi:SAM-dependent methyltransferase